MSTTARPYRPGQTFEVRQYDVEYRRDADGKSWQARIYQPQGPGPFPALLTIHGGAWSAGNRANNRPINAGLAASGLLVVVIDTRLGPEYPYPGSVQDVNFGTRWLKAHAGEHNGDAARVGLVGISSGGHLAMLSAIRPRDSRYAALALPEAPAVDASVAYVVTCWGVLDPFGRYELVQQQGKGAFVAKHDGYFLTVRNQHEANPVEILERGEPVETPPALVIQGTADTLLPAGMAERFETGYRAAGGEVELAWFSDQPHSFATDPGPQTDRALEVMQDFIARQLDR